jgi:hypothetical protein
MSKNVLDVLSNQESVDVSTVVRSNNPQTGEVQVEATITKFKLREGEGQEGADIIKKIVISAMGNTFDKAQDLALEKAAKACGLMD